MARYLAALVLISVTMPACRHTGGAERGAPEAGPAADTEPVPIAEVAVVQRERELLPGFDGQLSVAIDDITGGQVLVRVRAGRSDEALVPQQSMRIGDAAPFRFEGHRYAIGLAHLTNVLFGEDFATFVVGEPGAVADAQVARMIGRIERTDRAIARSGRERGPATVAAELRQEWTARRAELGTAERFLAEVVARSERGGDGWVVRGPGEREIALVDWLRVQVPGKR